MTSSISIPKPQSLVLADNKMLRYSLFVVLYFAQGIFEGFILFAVPVWMAANGKSAAEIGGFVAVILLPWTLKFLIGPIIDKFTFLAMGRKRPWIIVAQTGIFCTFICFSFLADPLNNIPALLSIGLMMSIFTAFQDVATDGLAVEITPTEEEGKVNALMWGSKVVSVSIWLAAGNWLINTVGFQKAVFFPAVILLMVSMIVLFVREHRGEKRLPWSKGSASAISKSIQPESWKLTFKTILKMMTIRTSLWFIGLAAIMQMVYASIDTLNKIFIVQQVNWTESHVSNWTATCILTSGLIGLFLGGFLIKRFGRWNIIKWGFSLEALICFAMYAAKAYWQNPLTIEVFTMAFYVITTLMTISMFAVAMSLCLKSIAASQFTIYMAFANVGLMLGAKLLGLLKEQFDWNLIFVAIALLALLGLFVFKGLEKALKRRVALDALNDSDPMPVPFHT